MPDPEIMLLTIKVRSIGRAPAQELSARLQTHFRRSPDLFFAGAETIVEDYKPSPTSMMGLELARRAANASGEGSS